MTYQWLTLEGAEEKAEIAKIGSVGGGVAFRGSLVTLVPPPRYLPPPPPLPPPFCVAKRKHRNCETPPQLAALLVEVRRSAAVAEGSDASTTTTDAASAIHAAVAEAEVSEAEVESAAKARAARVPERLLRALGARGAGLNSGGTVYGSSLLQVVEDIAAEAQLRGRSNRGACAGRMEALGNTSGGGAAVVVVLCRALKIIVV